MKIKNDVENNETQRVLREQLLAKKSKAKNPNSAHAEESDSVKVPLGLQVKETLEALKNDPARQARIAEIKQLLAKGGAAEYFKQVPNEKVASSLIEEIDLEILSNKGKVGNAEEA